jgi:hypothetical protein
MHAAQPCHVVMHVDPAHAVSTHSATHERFVCLRDFSIHAQLEMHQAELDAVGTS